MKFSKLPLIITLCFSAAIIVFFYTACERNVCDNVTCFNGGSCNVGACRCPLGYEDPQCQTKSVNRYLGYYAGFTTCDNQAQIFDTATVYQDGAGIINVAVALQSIHPRVLHGYVNSNESTYSIIVNNNDSTFTDSTLDYHYYTITLQSDNKLSIFLYKKHYSPTDTSIEKCSFLGTKL